MPRATPDAKGPPSILEDALNLPNLLTVLRVAMVPVVLWLMTLGTRESNFWAALLYSAAAVTDFLDGWLARRRGLTSILGKFLDPLADKLLVMSVLVLMVDLGRVPAWVVILILARELSVTALRTIAMSEGVVIAAGRGGKDKTALQMVALLLLVLHDPYLLDFGFFEVEASLNAAGLVMLYASLILALTSAGEYVRLFVHAVEAKERRLRGEPEASDTQEPDEAGGSGSGPATQTQHRRLHS